MAFDFTAVFTNFQGDPREELGLEIHSFAFHRLSHQIDVGMITLSRLRLRRWIPFRRVQIDRRALSIKPFGAAAPLSFLKAPLLWPLRAGIFPFFGSVFFFFFFWSVGDICRAMVLLHFPLVDRLCISSVLSDNAIHTCICTLHRSCI